MNDLRANMKQNNMSFFYDDVLGTYHYANGHPMKPFRVPMCYQLLKAYDIDQYISFMDVPTIDELLVKYYQGQPKKLLTRFHSDDYVELIQTVTPENKHLYEDQLYRYNFGEDCPVMDRLYDFCYQYGSASVFNAMLMREGIYKYGINYAGGLHHAKQSEASGFCYVNDIVLGALELSKRFSRVMYIDIDIHHGDGVEEAFYLTNRVLTCSFHKFGDFFPGTGNIDDVGLGEGKNYAINVPLDQGLDDFTFLELFKKVVGEVFRTYQPEAIIMQTGGDSLCGDRLGCWNLSTQGHSSAVQFVKDYGAPMLVVGGGGYTLRNVPRTWCYEISLLLGRDISNQIPEHCYQDYYGPENKLFLPVSNMENLNTKTKIEDIQNQILKNLKNVTNVGCQINNTNDIQDSEMKVGEMLEEIQDEKDDKQVE